LAPPTLLLGVVGGCWAGGEAGTWLTAATGLVHGTGDGAAGVTGVTHLCSVTTSSTETHKQEGACEIVCCGTWQTVRRNLINLKVVLGHGDSLK
jgi:hypothetical protein